MPPTDRRPLGVHRLTPRPELGPIEVVAALPSTNATLAERARAGAPPQVLVTEHQTAGRGRLARTWETPDMAALTFSVLLRPRAPVERWSWLPLLTGLAVDRALYEIDTRVAHVSLKWPNDVLIGERKVAGILVERVESPAGPAAVVGIGLNVDQTADELPADTATSIALAGGAARRTALLLSILGRLGSLVSQWDDPMPVDPALTGWWVPQPDVPDLREAYVGACSTLGRDVRVELPGGEVLTGRATDVDAAGRLVVATATGERVVGAGDVVHVRTTASDGSGDRGGAMT